MSGESSCHATAYALRRHRSQASGWLAAALCGLIRCLVGVAVLVRRGTTHPRRRNALPMASAMRVYAPIRCNPASFSQYFPHSLKFYLRFLAHNVIIAVIVFGSVVESRCQTRAKRST